MAVDATFLTITALMIIAVASHFVFIRLKQPTVIGELLVGILISIILVNILQVDDTPNDTIKVLAQLGAIVLLFIIGLECDVKQIFTKQTFIVAALGVIVAWSLGFLVFYAFIPSESIGEVIFGATIFVSTSVSVSASVLQEMGLISDKIGQTIIGAAVVDDILGMVAFAIAKGVATGEVTVAGVAIVTVEAVVFIVLGIWLGKKYLVQVIHYLERKAQSCGLSYVTFILGFAFALLYAFIAEVIGISAIVGAFVAGAVMASLPLKHDLEKGMKYLGALFVPLFFITAGLAFNLDGFISVWLFAIVITIAAVISKTVGCGIGAKITGLTWKRSLAVGTGMVPRLEVPMVIATYGLLNGLIGNDIFSAAVFLGIATSLIGPMLFRSVLKSEMKGRQFKKAEEVCTIE